MRAIVWFRADLRVEDNFALHRAAADAGRGVVGVFALCPEQWREHDWADIKVAFLLRNLRELSRRLEDLRIPLLFFEAPRFANVPAGLVRLARRHDCDALYFNREYEWNERRRDDAVRKHFEQAGLAVREFDDQTILPPDAIQKRQGGFYTVFTPYKRAWLATCMDRGVPVPVGMPSRQSALIAKPDRCPERVAGFDARRDRPDLWLAGEAHARERLADFVDERIRNYKRDRDRPDLDGTSRLSPYLTLGVVSPRQCLAAAREANQVRLADGALGPDTWISELIWREFYRHVLVGFPRVSKGCAFRAETEQIVWNSDEAQFDAWRAGRTGFPLVDAGLRQLAEIGWIHNRLRMIVAMFLTKDLLIDWRWGERHFMRNLIDGDLASNNGGWQWSASTGTDAVPYFRIFNPITQSRRFDPTGAFIRRYVPELAALDDDAIHDPAGLDAERRAELDYPEPICDHGVCRAHAIAVFKNLRGA